MVFQESKLDCNLHQISQYETRSSRYRFQTDVRSLAPSPRSPPLITKTTDQKLSRIIPDRKSSQNLTGKPFLTYSIRPFIVELFTAEFLTRSPKQSYFGVDLSPDRQLPTPAVLNELALHKATKPRAPRTGFAMDSLWNSSRTRFAYRPRHRKVSSSQNWQVEHILIQEQPATYRHGPYVENSTHRFFRIAHCS